MIKMHSFGENRKLEIAAMSRKELNAHAYLCEQEQVEYEQQIRDQQSIISQLEAKLSLAENNVEFFRTETNAGLKVISQQTAEIERLIEVMDRASDMLSHNNESYKILQSAILTTIQGVDNNA